MIDDRLSENQLQEAFKHYDSDCSGKISAEELKEIIGFINDGKDKNEIVKQLIQKMDLNGDGEISFDEFVLLIRSM
jgi:Ca2+-binding EF-hand superfamily protein